MAELSKPFGKATAQPAQITVEIDPVDGATGYTAQVSTNNFVSVAATASGSSSPLVIASLTNGTPYKVRFRATGTGSPSPWRTLDDLFIPAVHTPDLSMVGFGDIELGDEEISVSLIAEDSVATGYTVQASEDNFETISGTESAADVDSPLVIDGLDNGSKYKIRAFATRSGYNNSSYRVSVGLYIPSGAVNLRPVASAVSISGTPQVGVLLTGNYTRTDAESDAAGTPIFKWYKNDVLISGATAQTYTPVTGDTGATLKFGVIVTSLTGASPGLEVKSAASATVAAAGGGGGTITGYYLMKTTGEGNGNPTEAEILAGTSFVIPTSGANYSVTVPNPGLRFIQIFEPSTETLKTVVNDGTGDAAINTENAFGIVVTVGAFRGYKTNYETAVDLPLQMKIS